MRVTQKATAAQALAHFRKGGMVSFSPSGINAYTSKYESEANLRHRLAESWQQPYIVLGVGMDEVRDKIISNFPLHQVITINGTDYAVRKVTREGDEMILSLEARENQPHAYMSVRVSLNVWEN